MRARRVPPEPEPSGPGEGGAGREDTGERARADKGDPDWVIALDSMAEPERSPFFEDEPPPRRTLLGRRRQS